MLRECLFMRDLILKIAEECEITLEENVDFYDVIYFEDIDIKTIGYFVQCLIQNNISFEFKDNRFLVYAL